MSTTLEKDLTKEAPRSPRIRLGGYAIMGRTIDKCHALLAGKIGDYHFDCPLDNMLFGFKGVTGADFKEQVQSGATDQELIAWLNDHGAPKTPEEIRKWSDNMERYTLIKDPEKKDYFIDECRKLGIDPYKAALFDWLEADDKASFK